MSMGGPKRLVVEIHASFRGPLGDQVIGFMESQRTSRCLTEACYRSPRCSVIACYVQESARGKGLDWTVRAQQTSQSWQRLPVVDRPISGQP
jgi:hypothetical protein